MHTGHNVPFLTSPSGSCGRHFTVEEYILNARGRESPEWTWLIVVTLFQNVFHYGKPSRRTEW